MNLSELVKVPDEKRDIHWENHFFNALSQAQLNVIHEDPQNGPDGWPYLLVETSEQGTESAQKIIHWLSTRGIGLVVNPLKDYPDFVFPYGMLWHFRETGLFYKTADQIKQGQFSLEKNQKVISGDATTEFMPDHVRQILRDFFRDQAILLPRILVMSTDGSHFDLFFSVESLGNPPDKEHQGIAEAISWFLPPHYSVVLMSEKNLPNFYNL